jgi:hypothetical protein
MVCIGTTGFALVFVASLVGYAFFLLLVNVGRSVY